MGRKKITIQKIEQKKDRLITFCKRRLGLLKKAAEISILCDVHVFLAFTDLSGAVFQFDSFRDSDTSDRRRDMEATLDKIKTGNFVTYDLSQYPFDELKQQQPTPGEPDREDGPRAEAGHLRLVAGHEGTSEVPQIRYHNPASISQIKSSLDRVLNTSADFAGHSKIHDELRHRGSHAPDLHDFSEELSTPQPATPSPLMNGEAVGTEPMRQDKYAKKVSFMSASLESCRTEQALWSFIQSKGEEHEPLQIEGERLKRIRGRLRRDFLFECSRFKISQSRNDQDVNELVVLYFFVDKYLDLSLAGAAFDHGSFAARVLGVCSGSVMQALAGSFSFAEALSQEAKGRTKVLAEYFLRRFLDPSFHQYSPPNYMLVNCLAQTISSYLQSVNLLLALNGSKSLSSTSFMLDQEQLEHVGHLLELTLRIILAKETTVRDLLLPGTTHFEHHKHTTQEKKLEPPSVPKREAHCSSCAHQTLQQPARAQEAPKALPVKIEPVQPPLQQPLHSQPQETASNGARVFSGAAGVFGCQKILPRPKL